MTAKVSQHQLEEMVWDRTIGRGEVEVSTTNMIEWIERDLGEKIPEGMHRIVQRKLQECKQNFYHP